MTTKNQPKQEAPVPVPETTPAAPTQKDQGSEAAPPEKQLMPISDPILVLQLALAQERLQRLRVQTSFNRLSYDLQKRALEEQRFNNEAQTAAEISKTDGEYRQIQKNIEEKHKIDLQYYMFDPDAGLLNPVPGVQPK